MKYITRVSTVTTVDIVLLNRKDEVITTCVEVYGITPESKDFERELKKMCEENGCMFVRIDEILETRTIKFMMEQQEFYMNAIKKNIEKN